MIGLKKLKAKEQKQRLAENVNLREYVNKAIERESLKKKISKPMKMNLFKKFLKF